MATSRKPASVNQRDLRETRLPDFLGIGTTRGGSSWLYRVLSRHPEVWMPPVKELHYFDRPMDGHRTVAFARRELLIRARDYLIGERKRSTADTLRQTLRWDAHYLFTPRSLHWYRNLFRPREGQLTGEVTPAYAILDSARVDAIAELMPDIKAIYILRNPIDRAWSSVVNSLARKRRRNITTIPAQQVMRKAESVSRSARSDYAANVRRWRAAIGHQRLFIGYMEEIKADPEQLMQRICGFLGIGLPDDQVRRTMLERVNTTSKFSAPMPPEVRRRVAELLLPKIEDQAALFGGYAEQWLEDARRAASGTSG
ncbi:MAG: sulfotransferase [Spirochaetaceae bacterium]|nr:MAG: sulfotransferase [Spirochaetaceae bacterium]